MIKDNVSLVLFGSGSAGIRLYSILTFYGVTPNCFCDNKVKIDNARFCQTLPVITFSTLKEKHKNSLIFITTLKYIDAIKKQLIENGFKNEQLIEVPSLIEKYAHFVVPQDDPYV